MFIVLRCVEYETEESEIQSDGGVNPRVATFFARAAILRRISPVGYNSRLGSVPEGPNLLVKRLRGLDDYAVLRSAYAALTLFEMVGITV
jgi:hypothetical protein